MIRGGRELTANISHELRTPLARIRIAEELLREKLERAEYEDLQRYLKDIREDIEELDHLIGRILDLSKLDLHERPFKKESIDLSAMINELLDRLTSTIDQKGLHLQKQLLHEHAFEGDPEAMRIALSNVLGNAVKYSPEDGELNVKTEPVDGGLAITVTNTSKALPEEDLDRIFEPFYRAGRSSETGSGLGLAITKKIIEKHGGRIDARNAPEGLKIAIHLPTGSADKRD
jgi:signal transduction histidine kinase